MRFITGDLRMFVGGVGGVAWSVEKHHHRRGCLGLLGDLRGRMLSIVLLDVLGSRGESIKPGVLIIPAVPTCLNYRHNILLQSC